ncbi:hypothetical protein AB7M35_004166 [Amorphus suaedae]
MTGRDPSAGNPALPSGAVIPFGAARLSADPHTAGRCFRAEPGHGPLRLSSGVVGIDGAPGVLSADDQAEALRARLAALSDPWSRSMRAFVDGYFAFVMDEIARSRDAIAAELAGFHGLYRPEDLRFAAWLPLPLAHLPTAGGHRLVPFAFWTGAAVLAVELGDHGSPLDVGAIRFPTQIARIDGRDLARDPIATLRATLPAEAIAFWAGSGLPAAPARTAATLALPL